jgi:hypothetical protein
VIIWAALCPLVSLLVEDLRQTRRMTAALGAAGLRRATPSCCRSEWVRMHDCTPVAARRGESAGGQRRSRPSPGWGSRSRHRDGPVEREREALCASWRKEYIVGGWTSLGKTNARRLPGGGR